MNNEPPELLQALIRTWQEIADATLGSKELSELLPDLIESARKRDSNARCSMYPDRIRTYPRRRCIDMKQRC